MKKQKFDELFIDIIKEIKSTRDEGQKEYAHTEDNVFANFERVAKSLNTSKEKVLMVYLLKHIDGINSWINGHKSQREDVTGRIKDAIVYLCLLWGMTSEDHITSKDINQMLIPDKYKIKNGSLFNPETGEVKYASQTVGDEVI
tara:strand:+ start:2233 stop:2664 length:432 start_codon:yes stop_codon:yes gene_type:complete